MIEVICTKVADKILVIEVICTMADKVLVIRSYVLRQYMILVTEVMHY